MQEIIFEHVTFQYPGIDIPIFEDLSLSLTSGLTTLVGQNGTGKSTFLLLASGLLLPTTGKVWLQGKNTADLRDDSQRQRYISFIFQNMEFESEAPIGDLLQEVLANGFREQHDESLIHKLVQEFELDALLQQKTQEVSKGELQRTILAFSLLYGSKTIMMDEPIFALEEPQKHRAMKFLRQFAAQERIGLYYAVHNLEISQAYSDQTLLFKKEGEILYGPTSEILTREHVEAAYEMPLSFLKQQETVHRDKLNLDYKKHRLN